MVLDHFDTQTAIDAYVISQIVGGIVAGLLIVIVLLAAFSDRR